MSGDGPSIQRRLTVTIVAIVGASLLACSLTVYVKFRGGVWREFDARLAQDASAIALMVEEYADRPWEIEPGAFEAFEQMRGPASVELWMDDGSVLGRAAGADLPLPPKVHGPIFSDFTLRDGRPGRLCRAWLAPRQGHEGGVQPPSGRKVAVAVARDIEEPTAAIAGFRVLLWGPTLGVVLLAALAASLSSKTVLGRVTRISEGIAALDASSPGDRLHLRGVPHELKPPFVKLNELLSRIEASRVRERQFNADVSHELRTPLAGLRSILEVSAWRGARSASEYKVAVREALAVVRQMESIVENLLVLARLGSGQAGAEREEIALAPLVDACHAPYAEVAARRHLRFDNRIPPTLLVWSDPHKLRLVLANLLSNAAEYTADGGWIAVESHPERGVLLAVRDSGPSIPSGAVARIFDPFFRLDPSRAGRGEHCGIGLALVRALCEALGYGVEARNEVGGSVAFIVSADASSFGCRPSRRAS